MHSRKSHQCQARAIIHVDMDAFYASVEQRDCPQLKGKPVIVGGSPEGRGVVSAASYEARKFGVHSAQPMRTAQKLCPEAIILPVRMERYHEVSREILAIFRTYTPLVESISLDEAFLDVTGSQRLFGSAERIGREISARIKEELGLTASVGVAPSKFLAKLASDLEKPDGFVVISDEEKERRIADLPVRRLWGVGEVTQKELEKLGVRTIGEVAKLGKGFLEQRFGKAGSWLYERARGIDESVVSADREAKSMGAETTFAEDIAEARALKKVLLELSERVAFRLREAGLKAKTVTLKARFADFHTLTRDITLDEVTSASDEIYKQVVWLLVNRVKPGKRKLRLLGVTASHLSEGAAEQLLLFQEEEKAKRERLDKALDRIRDKLGPQVVRRGSLLEK